MSTAVRERLTTSDIDRAYQQLAERSGYVLANIPKEPPMSNPQHTEAQIVTEAKRPKRPTRFYVSTGDGCVRGWFGTEEAALGDIRSPSEFTIRVPGEGEAGEGDRTALRDKLHEVFYKVLREAEIRAKPFPPVQCGQLDDRDTWVLDTILDRALDALGGGK